MTNLEKYKEEIIEAALCRYAFCSKVCGLRKKTGKDFCPMQEADEKIKAKICDMCKNNNKRWLMREFVGIDWSTLKQGDKIRMVNNTTGESKEITVIAIYAEKIWSRETIGDTDIDSLGHIECLESEFHAFEVVQV